MELYDKQIEILRERHPIAAKQLLAESSALNIETAPARDGGFTASARLPDGRAHRLHSAVAPEGESEKLFRGKVIPNRGLIVLSGIGLGYPLRCLGSLWAARNDITVMAIEREPAALAVGLRHIDISEALADDRLILKLGDDAAAFSSDDFARIDGLSLRHVVFLNMPGPFALHADVYRYARRLIESMLPAGNRVIVLGLDGADPDILEQFISSQKLPAIGTLIKSGIMGRLKSTTPAHPGPAWAAFATGKNPGKTGVFGFQHRIPGSYRQEPVFSKNVRTEKIWHAANRQGRTVGLWNLPLTSPPETLNGFMIAGAPDHETNSYPPDILREMLQSVPENVDGPSSALEWDPECIRTFVRDMNRLHTINYASDRHPTDLQIAVFELLDHIQRRYIHFLEPAHPSFAKEHAPFLGDAVRAAYEVIDGIVQNILKEMVSGDILFLVSSHGARTCSGIFYLARFLAQKGYLVLNHDIDLDAASINNGEELYQAIDWNRTRVFPSNEDPASGAGICINLIGREPHGVVEPGDGYESLRDEIISLLDAVRHPETGEKIIENIHKREDIYTGDALTDAPDIIVTSRFQLSMENVPGQNFGTILPPGPKTAFKACQFTGVHSQYGVFIAFGKNIKSNERLEQADMIDIAPTILHAMGLNIPEDMDGRPLPIFSERHEQRHPVRIIPAVQAE